MVEAVHIFISICMVLTEFEEKKSLVRKEKS